MRELENLVERAVTLATDGRITADSLPDLSPRRPGRAARDRAAGDRASISSASWRRSSAASSSRRSSAPTASASWRRKLLGISFRSLRYRLAKLGISGGEAGEAGDGEAREAHDDKKTEPTS